jgi:hypothetical protein
LAAPVVTPPLQALFPAHATVHELPLQLIEPAHEFDSEQAMSQLSAWPQSIPFAHPSCPQVILQERRFGQMTTDPQAPAVLQSMTHMSSV